MEELVDDESFLSKCDTGIVFFARQNVLINKGDYAGVVDLSLPEVADSGCVIWHKLMLVDAFLWIGRVSDALIIFSQCHGSFNPPEKLELSARLALLQNDFSKSLEILSPLLDAGDASFGWELAIHALNHICETSAASTMLQRAATLFPKITEYSRQVLHSDSIDSHYGSSFALLERSINTMAGMYGSST